MQKITFFYPYPEELQNVGNKKLDELSYWMEAGKTRRRVWIVRTYLNLSRNNPDIQISDQVPDQGIVVLLTEPFFLKEFKKQIKQYPQKKNNIIVATIRADILHHRCYLGDIEIVQNSKFSDDRIIFFVPHWTQPAMIPRDKSRGNKIENIVFKGYVNSIHPGFKSETWSDFLKANNLKFELASNENTSVVPRWHDYSNADLVIAVRPQYSKGDLRYEKPATKLINCWIAGVPAIVGKEYAFQELKKSSLDYLEVDNVNEAINEVRKLLNEPELYRSMIKNGLERSNEFTDQKIKDAWIYALQEGSQNILNSKIFRFTRRLPLWLKQIINFLINPPSAYEFRKMIRKFLKR